MNKLIIINILDKIMAMARSYFIQDKIEFYNKKLRPNLCDCPVIQETVSFTSEGLHHLFYDNNKRRPRSHNEQHYRAGLIPYLQEIVSKSTKTRKEIKSNNPLIVILSIFHEVIINHKKQVIEVDLIKRGNSGVKFLSARRKKYIY